MRFKNLSLVFFSVFILLIFIEIILRFTGALPRRNPDFTINEPLINISDPVLGWVPKEGDHKFKPWSNEGKETYLTINKDKSRFTGSVDENKSKIVFIGGSITQGWAVSDDETFSFMIQKKNTNYKIYNFGVGGYGGYQSLLMLEKVFKDKNKIKLVVYGLIPHHEVRNTAAGSWMYLLNFFTKRGFMSLPYGSIDKKKRLIKNKPIEYITLPFGKTSALVAKIEKRIMKVRSLFREKKKTEISLAIINEMNKLSLKNNSKFVLLMLEEFHDAESKDYDFFLKKNNISFIKCPIGKEQKFNVPGEGHPNKLSHQNISECIYQKIKIIN
jgi:hypothetical protein